MMTPFRFIIRATSIVEINNCGGFSMNVIQFCIYGSLVAKVPYIMNLTEGKWRRPSLCGS